MGKVGGGGGGIGESVLDCDVVHCTVQGCTNCYT